ncbi:PAAR domain-containing protein (plasmid) [Caballeronia sp. NK8]|uniref:PAAR domain-containing protein n=1 Tax=Caballeronia sp. NK8 TaxID=140098 RepID=UPI001BB579CD|nr:PAAR domain-containing protein [Caballeronia sp. NK8]BCQ27094.1 PAAR domain-containing protein [Caballeronia sp. NK8]
MMRRFAVVGDKLSNNGEICDYKGAFFLLGGRQAALINGAAYCPVCQTTGYIAKEGGPRRMTIGASEIALEYDVVVCGCPEYPRIFARLAGEAWYDDLAESLGVIGAESAAPARAFSVRDFDEQVRAAGASEGYPYFIEIADGRKFSGRIEYGGVLPRIMTGANAGNYIVYWGDDALAKADGN